MYSYCTDHARRRMAERWGTDLTEAEWRAAMLTVLQAKESGSGQAILERRTAAGPELWHVKVGCAALRMVWNPAAARFTTVLPVHTPKSR